MTVKEIAKSVGENVNVYICINPNKKERIDNDDPLQMAAYGDFIVDKVLVLSTDEIGVVVKMQPIKA